MAIVESEDEEASGPADAVLVTDGRSPTGEQLVLQLILSRYGPALLLVEDAAHG